MKVTQKAIANCARICVRSTTVEDITKQLAKMKGYRVCGPDLIPIEVWKHMGEQGIVFIEKELNEVIASGIPSSWRRSERTPLIKGKKSHTVQLQRNKAYITHFEGTGADNRPETKVPLHDTIRSCGALRLPCRPTSANRNVWHISQMFRADENRMTWN